MLNVNNERDWTNGIFFCLFSVNCFRSDCFLKMLGVKRQDFILNRWRSDDEFFMVLE